MIKRMLAAAVLLLGFVLCTVGGCAQRPKTEKDKTTADKLKTVDDQYRSLVEEYETAKQQYNNATREATTEAPQAKAQEMRPDHAAFARRALELAEKNSNDPAALDALQWIAVDLWRPGAERELEKALDLLVKDHTNSAKLDRVCQCMASYGSWFKPTERVLREILEKSPHKKVQGHACFALARHLGHLDLESERRERDDIRLGIRLANAEQGNREKLRRDRADLLKRVVEEYGNLEFDTDIALAGNFRGDLGEAAKRDLFELQNIAVGKMAPEIEGEDLDGKKFKLSDYRGKVVLLDFWAFW